MTAGERAVWAAEFVRAHARPGVTAKDAVVSARFAVESMRLQHDVDEDTHAMLDDMLCTGEDRCRR